MNAYNKKRYAFYMSLVEHFWRLAVRRRFNEVQGSVNQKWHQDTVHWLNEKCTPEERKLVKDFYTMNQSVRGCTNYQITDKLYDIADRFAAETGLC